MAILKAGIAPANAAYTDSDVVAVGNAPVTVDLIGLLGPVMCQALLGCRLINEVSGDRTSDDPHRKCLDDDECKYVLSFDHGSVV